VIIARNHRSGKADPPRIDRTVTFALRRLAELVGVPLLDHLIVTSDGHHTFREELVLGGVKGEHWRPYTGLCYYVGAHR
jgi:DNA repair protein RadC